MSTNQSIKFPRNLTVWLCVSLFLLCILPTVLSAQYGWNFKYLTDKTTHWGHLASGDTLAIARLRFSKALPTDPTEYKLINFGVRPITNHASTGFVHRLQLWMDDGDSKFTTADSLLLTLIPGEIPLQSIPTYSVSVATDITLTDNQMLFIVAFMPDWQDDEPENTEIDTSSAGPDGIWYSVVDSLSDLVVTPDVAKNINSYTIQHFPIQAKNLPVTVRNSSPTSAEDDSTRLNMFYANFEPRSNASKSQHLDDLSFTADIYLPREVSDAELKLESAGFDFGFDNSILSLESIEAGNVWGASAFFYVNDTLYMTDQVIAGQPNYMIFHCEYVLKNCLTDTTTWREINHDTATVARLNFKVLKPGISPIFVLNEDLRDHYGIRYHTYRTLQNHSAPGYSPTTDRYDAWAKYILGDWTSTGLNQIGDGRVTVEDITVFSNYIWLGRNNPSWYDRFDIGSAATHDPDEIVPDDTTNFYDLMVLAINYNRTNKGAFNQKIAVESPHLVELVTATSASSQTRFILKISAAARINTLYARLHFDKNQANLIGVRALTNTDENPLLLYPEKLAADGILDLNLFRLDAILGIDDQILQIDLQNLTDRQPQLILDSLEIHGADWTISAYQKGDFSNQSAIATDARLLVCYPNPFNNTTRINYIVPANSTGQVRLIIYDLLGRQIRSLVDRQMESGRYALIWDGTDEEGIPLGSSIYFIKLDSPRYQCTQKIILLR